MKVTVTKVIGRKDSKSRPPFRTSIKAAGVESAAVHLAFKAACSLLTCALDKRVEIAYNFSLRKSHKRILCLMSSSIEDQLNPDAWSVFAFCYTVSHNSRWLQSLHSFCFAFDASRLSSIDCVLPCSLFIDEMYFQATVQSKQKSPPWWSWMKCSSCALAGIVPRKEGKESILPSDCHLRCVDGELFGNCSIAAATLYSFQPSHEVSCRGYRHNRAFHLLPDLPARLMKVRC